MDFRILGIIIFRTCQACNKLTKANATLFVEAAKAVLIIEPSLVDLDFLLTNKQCTGAINTAFVREIGVQLFKLFAITNFPSFVIAHYTQTAS